MTIALWWQHHHIMNEDEDEEVDLEGIELAQWLSFLSCRYKSSMQGLHALCPQKLLQEALRSHTRIDASFELARVREGT